MAEIKTASDQAGSMLALIEREKNNINGLLPVFMKKNADRFLSIAIQAAQNPSLAACVRENPISVVASVLRGAQLGLLIDGRKMALVPRKMKGVMTCCPEVMYAGLLDLVRRMGDITTAKAEVVYRHEVEAKAFDYQEGTDAWVKHKPLRTPDIVLKEEDIWYAYAWCRWRDGHVEARVITRQEIEKARGMSQAKSEYAPWQTHYAEMAMKTAIKRMCRTLPMPDDVQQALADEDAKVQEAREAEAETVTSRPLSSMEDLVAANRARVVAPEPEAARVAPAAEGDGVPRMVKGIPVLAQLFWETIKDTKFQTGPKLFVGRTPLEIKAALAAGDKAMTKQAEALMEQALEMYSNGEEPSRPYQMVALMLEQIELGERF